MVRSKTLVLVLITLLSSHAFAETIRIPTKRKGAGPFFQFRQGDKWGYIDRGGQTVIRAQFDDEHDFFHGLAGVEIDRKWGFVDEKGSVVIAPRFDFIGDFLEDLAPVRIGKKWGYINTSGQIIIEPRFQGAGEFHDGLARVYLWEKAICVSGTYTKEDAPEYVFVLPDWVQVELPDCFPEGKYGFIDKTGALAIPARFVAAQDFSEGLAPVSAARDDGFGYIDPSGAFVIQPQFRQARAFSDGLASVAFDSAGSWGFVDRSGKLVIAATYYLASDFSEGLARVVRMESGTSFGFGYIDRKGAVILPPIFSSAGDFSEGLANVCATSCGYINPDGKMVIKNVRGEPFSDGLAVVGRYGKQVYIEKTGLVIRAYE